MPSLPDSNSLFPRPAPPTADTASPAEPEAFSAEPSRETPIAGAPARLAPASTLDAKALAALGLDAAAQLGDAFKALGAKAGAKAASWISGGKAAPDDAKPPLADPSRAARQARDLAPRRGLEAGLPPGGLNAFWATAVSARMRAHHGPLAFGAAGSIARCAPTLKVGVAGFSGQAFDVQEAERILSAVYAALAKQWAPKPASSIALVSGLTDEGICSIAYRLAVERGWRTQGVVSLQALAREWFPVDRALFIGQNWGDDSPVFVNGLDALVRVGGGAIARKDEELARARGIPVLAFEI